MTCLTWLLTISGVFVWVFLLIGGGWMTFKMSRSKAVEKSAQATPASPEPLPIGSTSTWESGYTAWFAVAKFVGALVGVVALNYFRTAGVCNVTSHLTCLGLLALNIVEALFRDLEKGRNHIPNAITALLLLLSLPFEPQLSTFSNLAAETTRTDYFLFPTDFTWTLLYSTWNAAFSYGDNYSWITRLMLLPPFFVSQYLGYSECWLGARCLSLMCSMVMRATQTSFVYTPGLSPLTPLVGTIQHHPSIYAAWGVLNMILTVLYYLHRAFHGSVSTPA